MIINRGNSRILNLQVQSYKELDDLRRLISSAVGENETYVNIHTYLDNEECQDLVEEANEKYTDVDVYCFFS